MIKKGGCMNSKEKLILAELSIEKIKLNYMVDCIINDAYESFKLVNEN